MSWQPYIDRMAQEKVEMSGIYAKDGAQWAKSPNFNPCKEEILYIAEAIRNNDESIYQTGVRLMGKNWTVILLDKEADVLVLKGKEDDNNKQNMIVAPSCQALIMGANVDEKTPAGTVRVSVEKLRDYLRGCNY